MKHLDNKTIMSALRGAVSVTSCLGGYAIRDFDNVIIRRHMVDAFISIQNQNARIVGGDYCHLSFDEIIEMTPKTAEFEIGNRASYYRFREMYKNMCIVLENVDTSVGTQHTIAIINDLEEARKNMAVKILGYVFNK